MRRYITILGILFFLAFLIGGIYIFIPRPVPNWRRINVSYVGLTNTLTGTNALFSIRNNGELPVALRGLEIEYIGVPSGAPSTGNTNLVILTDAQTNLVIIPASQSNFLLPLPDQGNRWIAHLEFTPATIQTKIGEHLIRRPEAWARSVPHEIGIVAVHTVSQEFTK
jgi:hypothetical protein